LFIALQGYLSQSYGTSLLDFGSHSVNCRPTQMNMLTPARQAGIRFASFGGMEDWVDLGCWLYTQMVYYRKTVTRSGANQAQHTS